MSLTSKRVLNRADKKTGDFLTFLFGCVAWSLWLIRNDFVFNNVVISAPVVSLYRVLSFMQRWGVLSKGEGKDKINRHGDAKVSATPIVMEA
jgi:hypothetical protein